MNKTLFLQNPHFNINLLDENPIALSINLQWAPDFQLIGPNFAQFCGFKRTKIETFFSTFLLQIQRHFSNNFSDTHVSGEEELYTQLGFFLFSQFWPTDIFILENCEWYH